MVLFSHLWEQRTFLPPYMGYSLSSAAFIHIIHRPTIITESIFNKLLGIN